MNKHVKKRFKRKPAIIVMMLTICMLGFFSGNYASASTVKSNKTSADSTDTTNKLDNANNSTDSSKDSLDASVGPFKIQYNADQNSADKNKGLSSALQMLLILTVISLAPSILIMLTSFSRIIIVLHFVRSAIGTQTTPPNQILVGLALFITLLVMSPTFDKINTDAIQPLAANKITQEEAFDKGIAPLRTFMLRQIDVGGTKDLKLFMDIAKIKPVEKIDDIPTQVIIPAFIISELKKAFIIGFVIYIPFIIIDMVVASTLMSMGMMMLPPTMISMPFKILLFIIADGWNLIIGQVVKTFY